MRSDTKETEYCRFGSYLQIVPYPTRPAKSSIRISRPRFTSHSCRALENTSRIILLLNRQQSRIFPTMENVLPIGLVEISFVEIGGRTGGWFLQSGDQHIGDELLAEKICCHVGLVVYSSFSLLVDCV
ncbi:hypothetical protein ACMFMF_011938 [Clarireedia jacksonii]